MYYDIGGGGGYQSFEYRSNKDESDALYLQEDGCREAITNGKRKRLRIKCIV